MSKITATAGRTRRVVKVILRAVAVSAIVPAAIALVPAPAHAASSISACFSYQGQRYQGLSTILEYHATDNGWYAVDNTNARVGSNGCINYAIGARLRPYHLRIRAAGVVPAWRGLLTGTSQYYGPSGNAGYSLGEGQLSFYFVPASWPTAPTATSLTDDWLGGMDTIRPTSTCGSSSAAAVTCYMDRHGMVGNVIVQSRDYDEDGIPDASDRYPANKYYY